MDKDSSGWKVNDVESRLVGKQTRKMEASGATNSSSQSRACFEGVQFIQRIFLIVARTISFPNLTTKIQYEFE